MGYEGRWEHSYTSGFPGPIAAAVLIVSCQRIDLFTVG